MSVINKMLQELDRRNAAPGSEAEQPPQQVKVIAAARGGREWFWWIVALLMLGAVAWVGWVAYQLRSRTPVATELAFKAAEQARAAPAPTAAPSAPSVPAQTPPVPTPSVALAPEPAPKPAPPAPVPQVAEALRPAAREAETLKLASAIETPIAERPAQVETKPAPVKPEAKKAEVRKPAARKPAARKAEPKPAAATGKGVVDKRERVRSGSEIAEAQFRRAVVLLNQGRVSEAEDQLVGALLADPAHAGARQTYVALLLEQQRVDAAKRVLNQTLSTNPAQPTFALALARLLAEQRDYAGALDVMDRVGSAAKNADFQALRGSVLQRLGRHQEAIDAYETAVQGAVQPGATWVGMGISLEAVGRKADAAQAYRRSLGVGLAREVREYAESRVRALE